MLKALHLTGAIEGVSAFALFCIAMPMKHVTHTIGKDEFYWIGMAHGVLWGLYAAVATAALFVGRITIKQYFLLFLLSLLPLGPLLGERWVLKSQSNER